ncbi:MAG: hypothetical protein IPK80_16195 [Nannocystis sp.]|nr:hypothetical protein [Nannocystis sp.]
MSCEDELNKRREAAEAAEDARADYRDQQQAAGEAWFFSEFHKAAILNAVFSPKAAPSVLIEKSMSALEKQGTAERAYTKLARARRAAERASRSAAEAEASLDRCLDANELEPVSISLSSTLTLRSRFHEEKILPPQGWSGTLPQRETTHVVEARSVKIVRWGRSHYGAVLTLDEIASVAPSDSTVFDERGRAMTHTITDQATSVKPGALALLVACRDPGEPPGFFVKKHRETKPLRSGRQTLTIRDPEGGCHSIQLPYADVPSLWSEVFWALRRRDSGSLIDDWTWHEQGDLRVVTRSWSTPPGTLLAAPHGEVTLLAERSSMVVTVRRRRP